MTTVDNQRDQRTLWQSRRTVIQRYLPALVVLVVFSVGLWQNFSAIHRSSFHPDESRWINRADYVSALAHPTSALWEDRYLIRGQPPMGSFVTGLGLLIQGRDLTTNGPWDFHYGNESIVTWNALKGNMPDPGDLLAARRTNAVIGALSCALLCLIVTRLTHWVGGLLAGLFLAIHPLQIYLASIGVSDAVFTLFFALSAFAALRLALKPTWGRTVAFAFVLALGASTKLTPILVSLPAAALGVIILLDPWLAQIRFVGRAWRWVSRVDTTPVRRLGWMMLSIPALTGTFFIAFYPYLWSDPIGRTLDLIDFRRAEMENQARIWPATSVDSRVEAVRRTWRNLEDVYSSTGRAIETIGNWVGKPWSNHGYDLPLALAGLAILVIVAWWKGIGSPHALTLMVIGVQSAVILTGLRVDFNRYYLPLVLTTGTGIGILFGWTWNTLSSQMSRVRQLLPERPTRYQRSNPVRDGI